MEPMELINIPSLELTAHTQTRAQQRAIRRHVIEMIELYGSELAQDRYGLTDRDADQQIAERRAELTRIGESAPLREREAILRAEIAALDAARGCIAVIADQTLVTVFRRLRFNQRKNRSKRRRRHMRRSRHR